MNPDGPNGPCDAPTMDTDVVIVGSGFGGSVTALRLAEAGLGVTVLEQGGRVSADDMFAADDRLGRLAWLPGARMFGFFVQHVFRHVGIVGGVGVGGGSLVYAAVLLRPDPSIFAQAGWQKLGVDWCRELGPEFDEAERMLGVAANPRSSLMDDWLRETAERDDCGDTFGPTPNGIFFGTPGETVDDPYFDGRGPARTGCTFCARCIAGCPHDSKNSLDRNYLYLAEALGARVLPHHRVTRIVRCDGGYRVDAVDPRTGATVASITGRRVIVAAGVVGTVDLLLRCRDTERTLPELSARLGVGVRTNSEAIVGVRHESAPDGLLDGTAISSHFYPDDETHITQNRFPPAYRFMRFQAWPSVTGRTWWTRLARSVWQLVRRPGSWLAGLFDKAWHERVTVLTVMQHRDSELEFVVERGLWGLGRRRLRTRVAEGSTPPPAHLPIAAETARNLASVAGGEPFDSSLSALGNLSVTAHILGGCCMGRDANDGVIDTDHQVFGHPGLYVTDASAIASNIGVNPSLTVAALAERAARRIVAHARAET